MGKRIPGNIRHASFHDGRLFLFANADAHKTFRLLQKEPYAGRFEPVEPREPAPLEEAERFDCSRPKHRHPRETKGDRYDVTTEARGTCTDGGNCC